MADYAAVPVQPIANGYLQIVGGLPVISGRGFLDVVRGAGPAGDFIVSLDMGVVVADNGSGQVTVINGQAVPGFGYSTGRVGPNGLDLTRVHVHGTARGQALGGLPTSRIAAIDVSYIASPGGVGIVQFEVVTSSVAGAAIDPTGANANGIELSVWNGNAGPDNASFQPVGPLFQGAFKFP